VKLLTDLIENIFFRIPAAVGKGIAYVLRFYGSLRWFWGVWGISMVLALGSYAFAKPGWVYLKRFSLAPVHRIGFGVAGCYWLYLTSVMVLIIPYQYFKNNQLAKPGRSSKHAGFPDKAMNAARREADDDHVFLGKSIKSRRDIYLSNEMRKMHTHVVGSTGSGKTDSVILPLLTQDMVRGRGALIMDAKGDLETLNKIHNRVKQFGREKDFLFFSLAYPEKSNSYNPLMRGNPTELKDKIISANVWTEEFYKKKSEETLLLLMKSLRKSSEVVTFQKLYELLSNEKKLAELAKRLKNSHLKDVMLTILPKFSVFQKDLAGLTADLGMIAESEFANLLVTEKPEIDLLSAYLEKKIVYFQLNAQGYEETARRFGRIILQDLKTVSNYIQAYLPEEQRSFYPVFVDEFSNFAYEQFIEFLNKARGAHLAILIAHQSLGDLEKAGGPFLKQVLENCNIKIILRQDDPASIETYARISGTETALKNTYQTKDDLFDKSPTGLGTVREVEEFRINPNMIRELGRGEAAIIIKQPFITDILQLDFIGRIP
jgi:type IV secretory pathway TraG/TraD family ATPase VirD4